MSEPITPISTFPGSYHISNCPVIISDLTLVRGNVSGKLFAKITFRNIQDLRVSSLEGSVLPISENGQAMGNSYPFAIRNLNASRDKCFGENEPVALDASEIYSLQVSVRTVLFANDTVWNAENGSAPMIPLPPPKTIEEAFPGDPDMQNEYRYQFGNDVNYVYTDAGSLWYCACGGINAKNEGSCYRCDRKALAMRQITPAVLMQMNNIRAAGVVPGAAASAAAAGAMNPDNGTASRGKTESGVFVSEKGSAGVVMDPGPSPANGDDQKKNRKKLIVFGILLFIALAGIIGILSSKLLLGKTAKKNTAGNGEKGEKMASNGSSDDHTDETEAPTEPPEWSDWMDELPDGISSSNYEIETRKMYKSCERETTSSTNSTMSGWELYDSSTTEGEYGSWSSWSTTSVSPTSTRKVESKKQYRSANRETTSSTSSSMSGWTLYATENVENGWGSWSSWSTTAYSSSSTRKVENKTQYRYCVAEYVNLNQWTSWSDYPDYNKENNSYYARQTRVVYRYCDMTYYTVYYFERYGSWSEWSDTVISPSSSRKVDERVVYRYKDKASDVTVYYFQRWGEWSDWTENEIQPSDDVKVETKEQYRYR